jgi:ferredoxin-NADP reductase
MAYLREDAPRDILCLAGGSGLSPMISIAMWAAPSTSTTVWMLVLSTNVMVSVLSVDTRRIYNM